MEIKASSFFATLGHQRRLDVFRLLMRRYPDTVRASEIASALDINPSTLSMYLKTLVTAGMISQFRQGNWLKYQVLMDMMNSSVAFLV